MNGPETTAAVFAKMPAFRLEIARATGNGPTLSRLVAELVRHGLRPVVVRLPSTLPPVADQGAETDAVAAAGGDVLTLAAGGYPGEIAPGRLLSSLQDLSLRYDIVLVTGDCALQLNTFRLEPGSAQVLPTAAGGTVRIADPKAGMAACVDILMAWLTEIWLEVPVWACVLIGGRSSRMGTPKHLLAGSRGGTWLEDTVCLLRPLVERVVLAGQGMVPPSLQDLTRITDVPGVAGPLAGILAAMRWQPEVSWLLVACDMPCLCPEALQWLVASRRPGRWATMPRRSLDSHVEPLLGHYDRRCRPLFEDIRLAGSLRIGQAARHKQVYSPLIPPEMLSAWENVNTPEELACLAAGRREDRETGER